MDNIDLSTAQFGQLNADGCRFAAAPSEFDAEANSLSISLDDVNGEWGVFILDDADNQAAADTIAAEAEAADAAEAAEEDQVVNAQQEDDQAAEAAAEEEADGAKAGEEVSINAEFDEAVSVEGENVNTEILFPENVSFQPTNAITLAHTLTPPHRPPAASP